MKPSGQGRTDGIVTIASAHFGASFDTHAGTFSISRGDGAPFLNGGVACVNTDVGKQSTASPGRDRSAPVCAFSDRLGWGRRMTVACRDPDKRLDLRVEVVVYNDRPIATIEAHCTNVSSADVVVESLEPIRVVASEGGALRVPDVAV